MAIGAEERCNLLDVLCAGITGRPAVSRIELNASQHGFRGNPVFQAGFPRLECCRLGISTCALRVNEELVIHEKNVLHELFDNKKDLAADPEDSDLKP
ncbi:TPA: hypothetical protein U2I22_003664 [Citrobacter koseri]|nr:hypothetical protein [Citrobacter koseri]HEM6718262.1 hypothetical protein [Citrobacter koseri]